MQQESLRLDSSEVIQPLTLKINGPSEIDSLLSFSYYVKGKIIKLIKLSINSLTYIS